MWWGGLRGFGEWVLWLKGVARRGEMEGFGVPSTGSGQALRLRSFAERRRFAQDDGLRGREGGSGFFDDFRWCAGIAAFGELGGGEEFGVAMGAVARTQEVEESLLADGDGCRRV